LGSPGHILDLEPVIELEAWLSRFAHSDQNFLSYLNNITNTDIALIDFSDNQILAEPASFD
jgi:hypothetical protein